MRGRRHCPFIRNPLWRRWCRAVLTHCDTLPLPARRTATIDSCSSSPTGLNLPDRSKVLMDGTEGRRVQKCDGHQ